MKPIICAHCGKALTSAMWDTRTEQVYCRDCIPPLPKITRPAKVRSSVIGASWGKRMKGGMIRMDSLDVDAHQAARVRYCERCARRALKLVCDDRSQQELCSECYEQLERRRGALRTPTTRR